MIDSALVPPQDLDAERAVLGACMIDPDAIARAAGVTDAPAMFYRQSHREVFAAALDLHRRSEPVDLLSIRAELRRRGKFNDVGDEVILDIANAVPTSSHVSHYAGIVRDRWHRREVIEACTRAIQGVHDLGCDPQEISRYVVGVLQSLRFSRNRGAAERIGSLLDRSLEEFAAGRPTYRSGLRGGLPVLTEILDRMRMGYMLTISAPTSTGKTAISIQLARAMAKQLPGLYYSNECPCDVLAQRVRDMEVLLPADELKKISPERIQALLPRVRTGVERLRDLPLYVMGLTGARDELAEIESTARWCAEQEGKPLGFVVIDRLELLPAPNRGSKLNDREELVQEIKRMAMRLGVIVVMIQQPSWKLTPGDKREPNLQDLSYGNVTSQCSQGVLFLVNEHWREGRSPATGLTEAHVLKLSDGPCGKWPLYFVAGIPAFFKSEHDYLQLRDGPRDRWSEREQA